MPPKDCSEYTVAIRTQDGTFIPIEGICEITNEDIIEHYDIEPIDLCNSFTGTITLDKRSHRKLVKSLNREANHLWRAVRREIRRREKERRMKLKEAHND